MIRYLIFISSVTLFSCTATQKYTEVKTKFSSKKSNIDTSYIEIPEKYQYDVFSSATINDTDYLAILAIDTVRVYNLNNKKKVNELVLQSEINDTDGNYSVKSIILNNIHDIFTISKKRLTRYKNNSISTFEINMHKDHYLLYNLENDRPYFDSIKGKIYLEKYSTSHSMHSKKFYRENVLSELDVLSQKDTDCAITYPALYSKNYYGYSMHVYFSSNDSVTVVSFEADPNIYLYHRNTAQTTVIGGRSSFQKENITPLNVKLASSREEKMKHWTQIPEYNETLIDKSSGYIYRFFYEGQPLKQPSGLYNRYRNKEQVLMIFNDKTQVVSEIELGKNVIDNYRAFTGKNKLYLPLTKRGNGSIIFKTVSIVL